MPSEVSVPNTVQAPELTVVELKRELAEAHRREAATAGVLRAISRSTYNLQDVLDSLIESAVHLTGAEQGLIVRQDGAFYRAAAIYGAPPEFVEIAKHNPIPPGRQSATGRAVLERRVVQIPDVLEDREYTWAARQAAGVRTILAVPMLRGDIVVGVIGCGRREVRTFAAKEIELLQTFADQAVIAIENTRLFEEVQARTKELGEALERQIATSEVLSVISSSHGELEPVFQAMLANAVRICEAKFGVLFRHDRGAFQRVASVGVPSEYAEYSGYMQDQGFRPVPLSTLDRLLLSKDTVRTEDAMAEPVPGPAAKYGGARSLVAVPMFKESELVGAIIIYRQEVRPFTDKQVELVKEFANQAVIAIESTRLLNELRKRFSNRPPRPTY